MTSNYKVSNAYIDKHHHLPPKNAPLGAKYLLNWSKYVRKTIKEGTCDECKREMFEALMEERHIDEHTGGRKKIDQMIRCATLLGEFFESKPDGDKYQKTVLTLKYLAKLNLVTTHFSWLRDFHLQFPESNVAVKRIGLDAFSNKGRIRFLMVKYHLAWLFVLMFKVKKILV